jgi:hypothetical protein
MPDHLAGGIALSHGEGSIDPDHIVNLIKRLIEIHGKWIVDGVDDAEDKENEEAGLREQQIAINEFAAQRSLPQSVRSDLSAAIRKFLDGGLTGDDDGPLVQDVSEDVYCAFAIKLSALIGDGQVGCAVTDRPTLDATALTVQERVLLFCVATGTDWQMAGIPANVVTDMIGKSLVSRARLGLEHLTKRLNR